MCITCIPIILKDFISKETRKLSWGLRRKPVHLSTIMIITYILFYCYCYCYCHAQFNIYNVQKLTVIGSCFYEWGLGYEDETLYGDNIHVPLKGVVILFFKSKYLTNGFKKYIQHVLQINYKMMKNGKPGSRGRG